LGLNPGYFEDQDMTVKVLGSIPAVSTNLKIKICQYNDNLKKEVGANPET